MRFAINMTVSGQHEMQFILLFLFIIIYLYIYIYNLEGIVTLEGFYQCVSF